jgi:hypothetical protein
MRRYAIITIVIAASAFGAGAWYYRDQESKKVAWKHESLRTLLRSVGKGDRIVRMAIDSLGRFARPARVEAARDKSYDEEIEETKETLVAIKQEIGKLQETLPESETQKREFIARVDALKKRVVQLPNLPPKDIENIISGMEDATFVDGEQAKVALANAEGAIETTLSNPYLEKDIRTVAIEKALKEVIGPADFSELFHKGKIDKDEAIELLEEQTRTLDQINVEKQLEEAKDNVQHPEAQIIGSRIRDAIGDPEFANQTSRGFWDKMVRADTEAKVKELATEIQNAVKQDKPDISPEQLSRIADAVTNNLPISEETRDFVKDGKDLSTGIGEVFKDAHEALSDGKISDDEKEALAPKVGHLASKAKEMGARLQKGIDEAEKQIAQARKCADRADRMISKLRDLRDGKKGLLEQRELLRVQIDSCLQQSYSSRHEEDCARAPSELREVEKTIESTTERIGQQTEERRKCEEKQSAAERRKKKLQALKISLASLMLVAALALAYFNPALAIALLFSALSLFGGSPGGGDDGEGGRDDGIEGRADAQGGGNSGNGIAEFPGGSSQMDGGTGTENVDGTGTENDGSTNTKNDNGTGTENDGRTNSKNDYGTGTENDGRTNSKNGNGTGPKNNGGTGPQQSPELGNQRETARAVSAINGFGKGGAKSELPDVKNWKLVGHPTNGPAFETKARVDNTGDKTRSVRKGGTDSLTANAKELKKSLNAGLPVISPDGRYLILVNRANPDFYIVVDKFSKDTLYAFKIPTKGIRNAVGAGVAESKLDFRESAHICGITRQANGGLLTYIDASNTNVVQVPVHSWSAFRSKLTSLPDMPARIRDTDCKEDLRVCCEDLMDKLSAPVTIGNEREDFKDKNKKDKGAFSIPTKPGSDFSLEQIGDYVFITPKAAGERKFFVKLPKVIQLSYICGVNDKEDLPLLNGILRDGRYVSLVLSPYSDYKEGLEKASEYNIIPGTRCGATAPEDYVNCCNDLETKLVDNPSIRPTTEELRKEGQEKKDGGGQDISQKRQEEKEKKEIQRLNPDGKEMSVDGETGQGKFAIKFVNEEGVLFRILKDGIPTYFGPRHLQAMWEKDDHRMPFHLGLFKQICAIKVGQQAKPNNYLIGLTFQKEVIIFPLTTEGDEPDFSVPAKISVAVKEDCSQEVP